MNIYSREIFVNSFSHHEIVMFHLPRTAHPNLPRIIRRDGRPQSPILPRTLPPPLPPSLPPACTCSPADSLINSPTDFHTDAPVQHPTVAPTDSPTDAPTDSNILLRRTNKSMLSILSMLKTLSKISMASTPSTTSKPSILPILLPLLRGRPALPRVHPTRPPSSRAPSTRGRSPMPSPALP